MTNEERNIQRKLRVLQNAEKIDNVPVSHRSRRKDHIVVINSAKNIEVGLIKWDF